MKKNGKGILNGSDGSYYEGYFRDDLFNDTGILTTK